MLCPVCREAVELPSDWSQVEESPQTDSIGVGPPAESDTESQSEAPGKGLWQLMGQPGSERATESDPDFDSPTTIGDTLDEPSQVGGEADATDESNSPKGLWSLMSDSVNAEHQGHEPIADSDGTDSQNAIASEIGPTPTVQEHTPLPPVETDESPKGLWRVMSGDSNGAESQSTESPDANLPQTPTRRWTSVTDEIDRPQDDSARDAWHNDSSDHEPDNPGGT